MVVARGGGRGRDAKRGGDEHQVGRDFPERVAEAVAGFGDAVAQRLRAGLGAPEDQLRGPVELLMARIGRALGLQVVAHGEVALSALRARPDYAIDVAGAHVGYIELKAPGKGVPPKWRPNRHDRTQWDKLKLLPNVLYSDGTQWAVYRSGKLHGRVALLQGDLERAGTRLRPSNEGFARVLSDFLLWKPEQPRSLPQLVSAVAGLSRLLRDEVAEMLRREQTGELAPLFTGLLEDWRGLLFPDLTDKRFADAYAQTVTFALLLARVDGIAFEGRSLGEISLQLAKRHSLMGKALHVLTEDPADRRCTFIDTLVRVIGAVDWDQFDDIAADAYMYLYERFLEHYNPALRRQSGSYYTPVEVVTFMVEFVDEILRTRLQRQRGLAADDVIVVDPAMGTGTFLVDVIRRVADTIRREEGEGAVSSSLRALCRRLIGFEIQTGPYAVAALRIYQLLRVKYRTEVPEDEVRFLTDTLDNPHVQELQFGQTYRVIARSRSEANRIKRDVPVMVVLGNPPYRERARGRGKWVEERSSSRTAQPSLDAFRAAGKGRLEYVLSNLYVYFWRWATWKVFDAHPKDPAGIVAFITMAGYTTGPGFAGMREYLRRTADEGWIVDLSPEGHRPQTHTRVFAGVQQPLCIGIFVRHGAPQPEQPARIHHISVSGTREEKYARLGDLATNDPDWKDCASDWQAPLTPDTSASEWFTHPALDDLLAWHTPGVKPNRTWVYAPDEDTLRLRWDRLVRAPDDQKARLFKETPDANLDRVVRPLWGQSPRREPFRSERGASPDALAVAYRSFDRQYVLPDTRLLDRPRPDLWRTRGARQIFVTEQHAHPISAGPGLTFTALIPDMHHYNGRGGRVHPLYRDGDGTVPNVVPGLLETLGTRLGYPVTAEDLLAYIAATVAHPAYTARFRTDLRTPGVRVPLTADAQLWQEAVEVGREVVWLHTYGERCADEAAGHPTAPPRLPAALQPKIVVGIPDTRDELPDEICYEADTRTLCVGPGRIEPVMPEVWAYEVSGMRIIKKWFEYRRNRRTGRRTSSLDEVRDGRWTAQTTTEFLRLLNVLGRSVLLEPRQARMLHDICDGVRITVSDLEEANVVPAPASARRPMRVPPGSNRLLI